MKNKNKSLWVIIFIWIIYSVSILCGPWKVRDVELNIVMADDSTDREYAQLFLDLGEGFSGDNVLTARINKDKVSFVIPRESVDKLVSLRYDPVSVECNFSLASIAINGKVLAAEEIMNVFGQCIGGTASLVEVDNTFNVCVDVVTNDPQMIADASFIHQLKKSTFMPNNMRLFLFTLGCVLAMITFFRRQIVKWFAKNANILEAFLKEKVSGKSTMQSIVAVVTIVGSVIIIMHAYLLGQKYFVFEDAGDSVSQAFPQLISIARQIAMHLPANTYDFTQGLGASQGYVKINMTNWVSYFGTQNVAYLLGISQAIKMVLAGVFFFLFMRTCKVEKWYSLILAFGYMYCGHMTIRASWAAYPNEVVLVALCLWAIELVIQKKDICLAIIALLLFGYHFQWGSYYSVIYLGLLMGYLVFRYFTEAKIRWKRLSILFGAVISGGGILLFVTRFAIFDVIMQNLQSDRAQGNIQALKDGIGGFEWDLLPRIWARTIGNATIGIIGNNYTGGYWNFLEDPTFYCGIFCLLLIPLAFVCFDLKQKIWYSLVYFVAILYSISPQLRIIMNGFSGVTFKLCSLWITILMLYTISKINWSIVRERKRMSLTVVSITVVLILGLSIALPKAIAIVPTQLYWCLGFIIIEYIAILFLICDKSCPIVVKTIFCVLVFCEMVILAYPIYNDRDTAPKDVYNDDTIPALEWIQKEEGDLFYRVDKQYQTEAECDSLVQNYFDTAYYVGGTGATKEVTAFYDDLGLPGTIDDNRRGYGSSSQNEIETLLGFKYILSKDDNIANYGYQKKAKTGEVSIYENEYTIPLGFVYHNAIERSQFDRLNMNQRQQILLKACLVEDGKATIPLISDNEIESTKQKEKLFDQYEIDYYSEEDDPFVYDNNPIKDTFYIEKNTQEELIAIQITFDKAAKGYIYYSTVDGSENSFYIEQETESSGLIYEINAADIEKIWWYSPSWANITSLRIAKIPKNEYYNEYRECVARLKKDAVHINYYTDNYVEASVDVEEDGIMYIPFINGVWSVFIDGEWNPNRITINDAFLGIEIPKGAHEITLLHTTVSYWEVYKVDIRNIIICVVIICLIKIWMHRKKKRGLNHEGYIGSSTSAE